MSRIEEEMGEEVRRTEKMETERGKWKGEKHRYI